MGPLFLSSYCITSHVTLLSTNEIHSRGHVSFGSINRSGYINHTHTHVRRCIKNYNLHFGSCRSPRDIEFVQSHLHVESPHDIELVQSHLHFESPHDIEFVQSHLHFGSPHVTLNSSNRICILCYHVALSSSNHTLTLGHLSFKINLFKFLRQTGNAPITYTLLGHVILNRIAPNKNISITYALLIRHPFLKQKICMELR